MRRLFLLAFVVLVLPACGDDEPADDGTEPPPNEPAPCGALEVRAGDGSCATVGVPPAACAEGFSADDAGGCVPVLPDTPCAPGTMALPGETACRAVWPCGEGTWGDIAVDAATEHVDGSYAGNDSDGTADRPWKTIEQGVDAAPDGGVVAVAAGDYAAVTILSPVQLEGRCPELVHIAGAVDETPAVYIFGAPGTSVRGLAVSGVSFGLAVLDATEVTLEGLWIHDTGDRGLVMQDSYGAAEATLSESLIEAATDLGVLLAGSQLSMERTVVRAIRPKEGAASFGYGIAALDNGDTGGRSKLTVRRSMVVEARSAGILVAGSDAEIEATLVRDVLPGSGSAPAGFGIGVELNPATEGSASLAVRASVVERALDSALLAGGASLTVENTTVRGVGAGSVDAWRGGILAQSVGGVRSMLDLSASTVEDTSEAAVAVIGSDATVRGSLLRRTTAAADGTRGHGVLVRDALDDAARGNATVLATLIEDHPSSGVLVAGADATLEAVLVRASDAAPAGAHGKGVVVRAGLESGARSVAAIRASAIEAAREVGLLIVSSDAQVDDTSVARTAPRASDGLIGDGVAAVSAEAGPPTLTLTRCRVEESARAGVSSFGATVGLIDGRFLCNAIDVALAAGSGASFSGLEDCSCGCGDDTGACSAADSSLDVPAW